MLLIDADGLITDKRVVLRRFAAIEKGALVAVRGIIVHQTGGPTAQSAFNSYNGGGSGAHLLIDKDGTIYQTASLSKQTWHVGKLRARCLAEMSCTPTELKLLKKFNPKATHKREMKKSVPARYPSNVDSIGIEIVGEALPRAETDEDKKTYELLTAEQTASLRWLVAELQATLKIATTEVFRHPTVSYKNASEAASAAW